MKTALITGITGQDGSLLADHLLSKGYQVVGHSLHSYEKGDAKFRNFHHLADQIQLITGPLADSTFPASVRRFQFDEVYHLGAASFPFEGFSQKNYDMFAASIQSAYSFFSSIFEIYPECRLFYAGSSEMFGNNPKGLMSESDHFFPRTLYGISKLASHHILRNYREQFGKFTVTGLLFNHESSRRGEEFVTRKITLAAARIKLGLQKKLTLGSLDTKRDWSAAEDFVKGFQLALAHNRAQDYVFSSGELHTIEDFVRHSFEILGLNYLDFIVIDPSFNRQSPVDLYGDHSLATRELNWKPTISFKSMIERMVRSDYDLVKNS